MALPKLNTAKYTTVIPSNGKEVEFRPYLVKEEKILMIAAETNDQKAILRAVKDVINTCYDEIDVNKLAMFDVEYLFLQLRAKSVGETMNVRVKCNCEDDCAALTDVEINVDDIEMTANDVSNEIELTKDVLLDKQRSSIEICIDSLKYGQEKNLVFHLNTKHAQSRSMEYLNDFAHVSLSFHGKVIETRENLRPPRDYYISNYYRQEAVNIINDCIQRKKYNDLSFRELLTRFITEVAKEDAIPYIRDLLFDLNGQVKESLNMTSKGEREDWFSRWGIHYLRSLQGAYQHELCNNFKDKGISQFGGSLFNSLRDQISDIFDAQPPPKRDIKHAPPTSRGVTRGCSRSVQRTAPAPLTSMRVYNNAGGGCCAEGSKVLLANGTYVKVEDIKKGDSVVTYQTLKDDQDRFHESYSTSTIECVVKTQCLNGRVEMVHLNNLLITPYHPIIDMHNYEKHWRYPISKGDKKLTQCNNMYSFVVENREALLVDRHVFATYGHNWTDQDVIRHDYFGTDRVIDDLKKIPSYHNGLVELTQDMFHRENDEIVKIE